nr:UDP-N-acetylmuramate--L-alanine ligase [Lachnospiraceae bacterium]
MSGLSEILKDRGFEVSGSDRSSSPITEHLVEKGIRVFIGQKAENVTPDLDLFVYTAAVKPDHPEVLKAKELGIPILSRAELLGQLMKNYGTPVAVSGTHGKTTVT